MTRKPWYKSKTLWVGVASIVGGVVEYVLGNLNAGIQTSVLGVVMIALRLVTREAIGKGRNKEDYYDS